MVKTFISTRRFLRCNAGGIAVAAAIAAPVLLMLAGGAIDLGHAEASRVRLQDALDAAVLSGASADPDGDKPSAERAFAANNVIAGVTPVIDVANGQVEGEAEASVQTSFLQLIGVSTLPIAAAARAVIKNDPVCVLLLEPTEVAVTTNSGADLNAAACPMHVNSSNAAAVSANNGSQILTESLCIKGGVQSNHAVITPQAATGCPTLSDPFAGIPEPTVSGACEDRTANGTGQIIRLPAGRCWRNVSSNSGGTIVFEPGLHKIVGSVQGNSQSTIQGEGVTLFFEGTSATLVGNSRSTINLSAPETGPTAGMLLWQSRTTGGADVFLMNSQVTGKLEGVIYLPKATLSLNSDVISEASYTVVITRKLILNSGSTFLVNNDYTNGPPLPRALRPVRLEH